MGTVQKEKQLQTAMTRLVSSGYLRKESTPQAVAT
jgi:hypothetical protein